MGLPAGFQGLGQRGPESSANRQVPRLPRPPFTPKFPPRPGTTNTGDQPCPPLQPTVAQPAPHRSPGARRQLLAFLLPLLAACGLPGIPDTAGRPLDPRWGSIVSARTHGTISKGDRIMIRFARDVAAAHMVGQPATGVLLVDPEVEGEAVFTGPRELVFTPAAELPSGGEFRVVLLRESLLGLPDDLDDYWFAFEVIAQDFELTVDGLDARAPDAGELTVTGTIVTADAAESEAVERVLQAHQDGDELEIEWGHGDAGLQHRFTIAGVTRGARNRTVRIRWNGSHIGVSARGREDLVVPGREVFRVNRVHAESDDRQFAVARFSDPLDPGQNLDGLVSLGDESFTLEVAGNTLRIIPAERLAGPATVALEAGIRAVGGKRLEERSETVVNFTDVKPGVRFTGRGVVLPDAERLTVPIETANVRSLQVTAFRVYESNIGAFLQRNGLSGGTDLGRAGRTLWRRTIELPETPNGGWTRYAVDVSDLVRAHRGSLIRLTLSINRGNSTFACTDDRNRVPVIEEPPPADMDEPYGRVTIGWSGDRGVPPRGPGLAGSRRSLRRLVLPLVGARHRLAQLPGLEHRHDREAGRARRRAGGRHRPAHRRTAERRAGHLHELPEPAAGDGRDRTRGTGPHQPGRRAALRRGPARGRQRLS